MRDILLTFDTETTSNKPASARVVQIAAVANYLSDPEEDHVIVNAICNPGVTCSPEASAVHGITEEMYKDKAPDIEEVRKVTDFITEHQDRIIIAGHNALTFDVPIIWRVGQRDKVEVPIIDTYIAAYRTLPTQASHKLGELTQALNLGSAEDAHDAMGDIIMVQNLIKFFSDGLKMNWEQMAEWIGTPRVLKYCPFGKNKGKIFGRSPNPAESKNYVPFYFIKWMCENFDDPSPDLIATVREKYSMRFAKIS